MLYATVIQQTTGLGLAVDSRHLQAGPFMEKFVRKNLVVSGSFNMIDLLAYSHSLF